MGYADTQSVEAYRFQRLQIIGKCPFVTIAQRSVKIGMLAEELPHGKSGHVAAMQKQVRISEVLIKNLRKPLVRLTEVSVRYNCDLHGTLLFRCRIRVSGHLRLGSVWIDLGILNLLGAIAKVSITKCQIRIDRAFLE